MSLSRNLVDVAVLASAASKIGYAFLGSQSAALVQHVKTSSLCNPTPTVPVTTPPQAEQPPQPESPPTAAPPEYFVGEAAPINKEQVSHNTPSQPAAPDAAYAKVSASPTVKPPTVEEPTTKAAQATTANDPMSSLNVEDIAIPQEVGEQNKEAEVRRVLKESRIPTSRAGRLWHYGQLATGLGWGALNESFKRATGQSKTTGSVMLSEKNVDRLVEKLSRMRGAALKMGQMLSIQGIQAAGEGRSMIPPQLEQVLLRVHDSANYMPKWQMEKVMAEELGPDWLSKFKEFDPVPIAAASIGQVHAATLASNNQPVIIKIQYPGVGESIDSDLNNLKAIITFSNLLPRGLYLDNTIRVTKQELAWECDYVREADNAVRFGELLKGDTRYKVPAVVKELCTQRVLVCERLRGRVLSKATEESQDVRNKLGERLLRLCLREVFSFRFMQTDPNWSNFFYNPKNGQIELLDFGACREYSKEFLSLYGKILVSAAKNDRDGVWQYSKELGFVTGYETDVMRQAHIDSVMVLGEPFRDTAPDQYDFSMQTITARVRDTIPVMLQHRLTPPPDETYGLHKKLSGAFLLCTKLRSQFDTKAVWKEEVASKFHV
ncbi:ABC1 family-domain-containing protein [Radiomyces spectabilis]|uniref:ABC1 family-domain-containing protein n=1 Tax=Radiomyces spectabilis TaxID=64574 RepID=UPI00221F54DC|nr:ABC1 family-domain-containing protein [Radiomyces spectabilis]KAI8374519.1 ABC1 family-domain-containing protein [Radiomyces spectabilis]